MMWFYGEGHENGNYVLEGASVDAQYANFQKNNPYSNTYNLGWKDHPNFKWNNNHIMNANKRVPHVPQAPQIKPSPLEEVLTNFMKAIQLSFEQEGRN